MISPISLLVAQRHRLLSLISLITAPSFFSLGHLIAMRLVFHDRSNLSAEKGIR